MEIEAKFRVPNREVHRQLHQLRRIAGFTIARLGRVEVVDRYFDTADSGLLAANYFCRLRTQGDGVIATLKSLGSSDDGLHRRDEREVSLPSLLLNPADWPESPARQLAFDLAAGAPLQPLFDLNQSRIKANLMDGARRVGEWSLDEVRAVMGKRPAFYYELEIELGAEGRETDLERVAQALMDKHGLEPEPCSKFARALDMLRSPGGPALSPVEPDEPMAEAGRKVMFTHFMKMLANEAGTRAGEDIEFLHDMRVATRRMRAAYRIFEPFYEKQAVTKFNKELRRAGAALGAVRDLDVLIEKAQAYEAALSPDEGLTIAPLLKAWTARREAARRDLIDYLDSRSYRRFSEDFRTFLLTPGLGALEIPHGEPVPHQVRHVVPRLILERFERVRAYETVLPDAPVTTYHALRIECKRLRYALEFFSPLLGPDAASLIKQVVALQELLGALQDAHVAEGLIVEFMAEKRKRGAGRRSGVKAYLLTQQQIQADLLGLFGGPWAALIGPEFRRSLGCVIATL